MNAVLLLITLTISTVASACIDISGSYASPTDTDDSKTTFIITQSGCDQASVSSILMSQGVQRSSANFKLDGSPATKCYIDFFSNCGTLRMLDNGIEKKDPRYSFVGDDAHGLCTFETSLLTKDESGNLVETIPSAECEDGFSGSLKPSVFYRM